MVRAMILMALLAGCGTTPEPTVSPTQEPTPEPTPASYNLTGTMALVDSEAFARFNDDIEFDERGEHCAAQSTHGYTDIKVGTQIVVTNESGDVLGTGELVGSDFGAGVPESGTCVWTFSIDGLEQAEFYTIEAGRRGGPTYSLAEMEAQDWTVALDIGG